MENQSGNKPWIKSIHPDISPPTLKDNTADVDRLVKGIRKHLFPGGINIDFPLVKELPHILRKYKYHVNAILFEDRKGWNLIDVFPSEREIRAHGLAVDLGSSTVVVSLINLVDMKTRDTISFFNPQIEISSDILTRIHVACQEGGLEKLRGPLVERFNSEIERLALKNHISPDYIVGMAVAGNTTMTHLLLGLDPHWICREPYIPVANNFDTLSASDLGLAIHPRAPVFVFPNVGSYFGGDLIAGILASGMTHDSDTSLLVDVGTNAEVVIGNSDWLMACAGAAGPALEGGVAEMGMMAGPGAIDKVTIDPLTYEFDVKTIEGERPIGICGSGMIDLVAQLFLAGMIDLRGKYVPSKCGDLLIEDDDIKHLIVVPSKDSGTDRPLSLSQTDIDGLIRSKAAMYTILTTITNAVNMSFDRINRFYVAGTFGTYISPRSAITIGMIPDLPLETFVTLGNTSLAGACMALVSSQSKDEVPLIRDRITYMELNVNQEFMNLFSAAKFIPHTDRSLFPSV